jgi:uncharacterized protein
MAGKEGHGMAVVTGATGAIGQLYAEGLAERGYTLLLSAKAQAPLEELAESITRKTGQKVAISAGDLADHQVLHALCARLAADRDISLLANMAGPAVFCPFTAISSAQIDTTIAVNVSAMTHLCRSVVAGFVARGRGTIVNFASMLAFRPWAEFNVHNASKAFVVALSQSLQAQLRHKGVLVQVVTPGVCARPFWERAGFPFDYLPPSAVMNRADFVAAALRALDLKEEWVFPSLDDPATWTEYEAMRLRLVQGMMHDVPASRYR